LGGPEGDDSEVARDLTEPDDLNRKWHPYRKIPDTTVTAREDDGSRGLTRAGERGSQAQGAKQIGRPDPNSKRVDRLAQCRLVIAFGGGETRLLAHTDDAHHASLVESAGQSPCLRERRGEAACAQIVGLHAVRLVDNEDEVPIEGASLGVRRLRQRQDESRETQKLKKE
jgi:hypothetical protein